MSSNNGTGGNDAATAKQELLHCTFRFGKLFYISPSEIGVNDAVPVKQVLLHCPLVQIDSGSVDSQRVRSTSC